MFIDPLALKICAWNKFFDILHFVNRFGAEVMETVISWTKSLCIEFSKGHVPNHVDEGNSGSVVHGEKELSNWTVLDIGTGNGLLLQELSKQG